MDREYFSIEAQQKRKDEYNKMERLKKKYKADIKSGSYNFSPIWLTDKSEIDFSVLGDEASVELLFLSNYQIWWTSLDNLFNHMASIFRNSYHKNKLWTGHDDRKITKALKFWEDENKMIPPILIMNGNNTEILPHDGKHRIALCHYFDVEEIPVIISDVTLPNFPQTFKDELRIN